ncbi:MAG TPA: zinc-binding alcohol dehydrogenase, partial [Armatimonadetes bacterium]|nr:zinc-binding alcohol dehydrogenase [Armatimonadota bacterium]
MPRELVAIAPRTPVLREYEEPPLQPNQVRIRSEFSAPKHGTELGMYRGTSPFSVRRWDAEYQLFLPWEEEPQLFPMPLGNMTIGTVVEVGSEVKQYKIGERVFGHFPIRETHTVEEDRIEGIVPEGMSPHAIVYWDPAEFALAAVRDAHVRLGDRVAIFGIGAIGIMCVQMCKLSGASLIIAIDPLEKRRNLAQMHGADIVLDPSATDVGVAIKDATDKLGVDVAIEASGSYEALHEAIRCTAVGGAVVPLAFYQGEGRGLRLGEEAHLNRATLIFSRANTDPNRDHPMWNNARIRHTAFELLRTGKLNV